MPDETTDLKSATSIEDCSNLNETLQWVWSVVARGRWWIVAATCFISLAVAAIAMQLPNRYVSRATVLVVQQQVSQRYVETDSSASPREALQTLGFEVLSAPRLLSIIEEYGLYPADKAKMTPDLLADRIRKDIDVEPLESSSAFTIAFSAATPELAREVTGRLTSLFIEENSRTRGQQAANNVKFLSDSLDAAKQKLNEQSQRLQAFKTSNDGELPEQQQTNIMALSEIRGQLEGLDTRLAELQKQELVIQSSLTDRLAHLQSERTDLLKSFTARHPEVIKKDHQIAGLQSLLDRMRAGVIATSDGNASVADDPVLSEMVKQALANTAEIDVIAKQEQNLKTESERYQARLNLAPVRQQQLQQILLDYDAYNRDYEEMQKKKMQSELNATLEENQEGQHFRLVDPPTLPVVPSSPKRLKICLAGLAGGLGLGLALAFFVDMRNHVFYSERSLAQQFAVPLVLGVPLVLTAAERRGRVWRIAAEWSLGCLMVLFTAAAEFYVYRKG